MGVAVCRQLVAQPGRPALPHIRCCMCVQCIDELKAERRQLQEQVDAFEEKLDECRAENAQLQQLQCVDQRLQCKTAECQQLAACNVSHCCWFSLVAANPQPSHRQHRNYKKPCTTHCCCCCHYHHNHHHYYYYCYWTFCFKFSFAF